MCCDRDVKDAPALVRKHDDDIEDLKPDLRDGEEVHGTMLTWLSKNARHV